MYLYWILKIESSSSLSSSGLYTTLYACSLIVNLGWAIRKHNCQTISIFFSSLLLFFSLITCVHHIVDRSREKKVDLELLLIFFFLHFFFSLSFFELLDTIRGRSSETNLVKRVKKERERERTERENLHTFNAHLYWIYVIYCVFYESIWHVHTT